MSGQKKIDRTYRNELPAAKEKNRVASNRQLELLRFDMTEMNSLDDDVRKKVYY
jgi:hypothetical protein